MNTDTQERLEALQANGWTVESQTDDAVVLERIISGRARRAMGRDLAGAAADAEELERRLADHPEFVRRA